MRSSYVAASTMGQLQQRLDLISNNMANVNTTGYKAKTANFSSLLHQQINHHIEEGAPRQTEVGIRQGTGARLGHTNVRMDAGPITTTDRPLDAALTNDQQFFQVLNTDSDEAETQFTRAGNFYLQPINETEVALVTSEGYPLLGEDGPIVLQAGMDDMTLQENGGINVTRNGQAQVEATLDIAQTDHPRSLESVGGNRYGLTEAAQDIMDVAQEVVLRVGALESSNVDLSGEMTSMLEMQRAYQMNGQSISIADQMSGLINSIR